MITLRFAIVESSFIIDGGKSDRNGYSPMYIANDMPT